MTTNDLILELAHIGFATILSIFGMWILAWYRVKRKWLKAATPKLGQKFEKYWVEIVITVVVVPQWPEVIRSALLFFAQAPKG